MLRPLNLIGTVGMMAMAIHTANAQQASDCQTCNNSGGVYETGAYATGDWQYANCECDAGDSGNSPGAHTGWNPPTRLPVNRDGIWYRNNWPQAWHGNSGGGFISNSPMVYQPTDTTQLGYSYAKVPTWQATRMIPPTPSPSHFHLRASLPRPLNGCPSSGPCDAGACQSCQQGYAINATSGYCTPEVAGAPAPFTNSQPVGAPSAIHVPQMLAEQAAMTTASPMSGVRNAAVRRTRTASYQKKGLFQLAGLNSLFE